MATDSKTPLLGSVVTQGEIEAGLRRLGLSEGSLCMVHSSLSSFGWVAGGAETVINALLSVVGRGGTVVMPTLCQRDGERRFETWDIEKSPSDVGRITEVFRLRSDAVRSDHACDSVAAVGSLATEITAQHTQAWGYPGPWGSAALGHGSPWEKLYQHDALYIFLGVDFRVNSMGHFVQHRLIEEALATLTPVKRVQAAAMLMGWLKPGVWPRYDFGAMEQPLAERNLVTYTEVGGATCRAISTRAMVNTIREVLRGAPDKWFREDFLGWWQRVHSGWDSGA